MGELETKLITQVVDKTQSELILFMIILVVALIAVVLPVYVIMSKDRKAKHELENIRQDKYIIREAQIIEVIKENSAVIAELKTTLESNGVFISEKQDRIDERLTGVIKSLSRIHERIDRAADVIEELKDRQLLKGELYEHKAV